MTPRLGQNDRFAHSRNLHRRTDATGSAAEDTNIRLMHGGGGGNGKEQ
jgi:hypothetical protein